MDTSAPVRPISVEEYISNPLYERFELIDGVPVELKVGSGSHSVIQANCCGLLYAYRKSRRIGHAAAELRCRLVVSGKRLFYLPDVSVVLRSGNLSEMRFLEGAPEMVVEIFSPDDSLPRLIRKIEDYFKNGTKLAWLVLPENRSVLIFTPDAPTQTALAGETLDGGQILPGLQIQVDELFG